MRYPKARFGMAGYGVTGQAWQVGTRLVLARKGKAGKAGQVNA